MESSYITFPLTPYHKNFNKRLIKTPKLFFYDTCLLSYLLGIRNPADYAQNRLRGNIFENLIVAEMQKRSYHRYDQQEYYFWQDSNGNEVDLLQEKPDGFAIYEIKATQTISSGLFKNMDKFAALAEPATWRRHLSTGEPRISAGRSIR